MDEAKKRKTTWVRKFKKQSDIQWKGISLGVGKEKSIQEIINIKEKKTKTKKNPKKNPFIFMT